MEQVYQQVSYSVNDHPEFTNIADYWRHFNSLDWSNYVLDKDQKYLSFYNGESTAGLVEFTLPVGIGKLLKNKIAGSIVDSARKNGLTIMRVRFWSNTSGYVVDRYRVEVTGHGSKILAVALIAVISAALFFLVGPAAPVIGAILIVAILSGPEVGKAVGGTVSATVTSLLVPLAVAVAIIVILMLAASKSGGASVSTPTGAGISLGGAA